MAKAPVGSSAAQQVLDAALAPLLAQYDSASTALAGAQAGQRSNLSGFSRNIIDYLKGTPPAIARDYQGAIGQQDQFAKTYAGMQAAANPASQIQADIRAIRGPKEQRAQVGNELGQAYGNSAASLYKVGGQIPNTAFAADKAGALAFARALPAIQGLQASQLYESLLASQAKDRAGLEADRAGALARASRIGSSSSTKPTTRNFPDGTIRQYNPDTGAWDVLARKPKATAGEYTSSQRIQFRKRAGKLAADAWHGTPTTQTDANGNKVAGTLHLTYQEAMAEGLAAGIPLSVMQRALNQYWHSPGFYAPWETSGSGEGRPKVPFQKRKRR